MGHVYMTLDGASRRSDLEMDLNILFNNFGAAEQATLRKFVKWHGADNWVPNLNRAQAGSDYNWPWSHRPDLGRPRYRRINNMAQFNASLKTYMGQFDEPQWDKLTAAILYWINSKFEANGHMRGHMMVDFKDSPPVRIYLYHCNDNPLHRRVWFHARRTDAGSVPPFVK